MATLKSPSFWEQKIGLVSLQKPAIVKSGTSIKEAVRLMQQMKIGCVLVENEAEKIAGIVTDGDLMHDFVGSTLSGDAAIDNIMNTSMQMVDKNSTVTEIVELFYHNKFRHIPVTDEKEKVIGILSVRRLMNYIAEHMPSEVLNLPPDSSIQSTDTAGG